MTSKRTVSLLRGICVVLLQYTVRTPSVCHDNPLEGCTKTWTMLKVEIDGACVMFEVLIEKDQWWMVRFYNLAQFKYSAYVKLRKINGGSFVFTIWHN